MNAETEPSDATDKMTTISSRNKVGEQLLSVDLTVVITFRRKIWKIYTATVYSKMEKNGNRGLKKTLNFSRF